MEDGCLEFVAAEKGDAVEFEGGEGAEEEIPVAEASAADALGVFVDAQLGGDAGADVFRHLAPAGLPQLGLLQELEAILGEEGEVGGAEAAGLEPCVEVLGAVVSPALAAALLVGGALEAAIVGGSETGRLEVGVAEVSAADAGESVPVPDERAAEALRRILRAAFHHLPKFSPESRRDAKTIMIAEASGPIRHSAPYQTRHLVLF